jgi:3-hydroxybutyryl-CoA dehydratase
MEDKPNEGLQEKRMSDLEIGQRSTFSKTITESDVYLFAGLTADFNAIHVDQEYAKTTQFGERIAHGFLIASLVQPCMSALTTPGGVSLNYNFSMREPVFFGDTITASAEVVEKRKDKPIVTLQIRCQKQDGRVCIDGTALIYMISEKSAQ